MHHPTDRITHTTAFVTAVVEHWLEREMAQWVHPMKDRSDDPSHHERTLLPRSYISLHFSHINQSYSDIFQSHDNTINNSPFQFNNEPERSGNVDHLFSSHHPINGIPCSFLWGQQTSEPKTKYTFTSRWYLAI